MGRSVEVLPTGGDRGVSLGLRPPFVDLHDRPHSGWRQPPATKRGTPRAPGTEPPSYWSKLILASAAPCRSASTDMKVIAAWLAQPQTPPGVRARSRKAALCLVNRDLAGSMGLPNSDQIGTLAEGIPAVSYGVHMDSEELFALTPGGASGYVLKRTAPEHILEPVLGVLSGGRVAAESAPAKFASIFSAAAPRRPHGKAIQQGGAIDPARAGCAEPDEQGLCGQRDCPGARHQHLDGARARQKHLRKASSPFAHRSGAGLPPKVGPGPRAGSFPVQSHSMPPRLGYWPEVSLLVKYCATR